MSSIVFTAVLILLRISGFIAGVPGGRQMSWTIKLGITITLSLILLPGLLIHCVETPQTWATILILSMGEFLLGLSLGLGVTIIFSALTLAGKLISYVSGLGANEIFDSFTGQSNGTIGKFLFLLGTASFLAINGHHRVIESLLHTYTIFPVGNIETTTFMNSYQFMTSLITQSFSMGLQLSLGIVTAILLALITMAIISRVAPMVNLFSVGWSINMLLTIGMLLVSLGTIINIFCQYVPTALRT